MLIGLFVGGLGAIVGSFLNVCIHRLPRGESIVAPSSHCPGCKKPIGWYDNIPLLSYLLLRGRCRSCGKRIPFRYFLVEFLTAAFFAALYVVFGLSPHLLSGCVLTGLLMAATFVDFERQEIPDEVSLGGIVIGLVISAVFPDLMGAEARWVSLARSFAGALAGGAVIYAVGFLAECIFKKEAMGGGDVKLLAMIGSFVGWQMAILTFFIAPLFGSIVGIVMRIRHGSETIPYGPYLSMAAMTAFIFGNNILAYLFYGL
ncbi:MAG: prepilin peptidase [Candidatus Omnitrophota bacterium]